jgi:hypothetical protein
LQRADGATAFADEVGGSVIVRLNEDDPAPDPHVVASVTSVPLVVVVVVPEGPVDPGWLALADVMVERGDGSLDDIAATITTHPVASTALALLLRGQGRRTPDDGLVVESAVYSTLQAGPEFAAWRRSRPIRTHANDDGPRVRTERDGATLQITLTRPGVRNALDARMRDELIDALRWAAVDPDIARVELRGEGEAFCAGGDLDEFGSRADPATAHLIRLQYSVGRMVARLSERTVVHLHGACVGSGIELAAFAGTVTAREDTRASLPELGLGLVPGAGGTVSLPARIGRLRTAWLALSGRSVDGPTAVEWGLADRLET